MTKLTVNGTGFGLIRTIDISESWGNSYSIYQSNDAAVIGLPFGDMVFEGSGFNSFDAHGYATSGTVTKFSIVHADLTVTWSDMAISAQQLRNIFESGNTTAFNDALLGGDDVIISGSGGSFIGGFDGNDKFKGSSGDDSFFGDDGKDRLYGGDGADILSGGRGSDQLTGGTDNDVFRFESVLDSKKNAVDTITDLTDDDAIDLFLIDANITLSDDQAFNLVGAFTGAPGQLTIAFRDGQNRTEIRGDVDGDEKADLIIYVRGNHDDHSNFVF
jgi:Ca2+-binding RTX toxin-like protein